MPAVLSVGRLYCDLIFADLPRLPSLGTEVFADTFSVHPGGGAYITAAHLAALGHSSALATMLPSGPFADLIRTDIEAANLDLTLSAPLPPDAGPQVTVAMATQGDRAFLSRRAGPACPPLSQNNLRTMQLSHIHIGELTSLVAHPEILDIAKALSLTLSVDCAWDDDLQTSNLAPLLSQVDVFLPNEAEFDALAQAANLAPLTVVKRGAKGASAITDAGRIDEATTPMHALDATGAGDAFNAGFLSAWLTGRALPDCLAAGNARGAQVISKKGGFVAAAQ